MSFIWPSASQFTARPVPRVIIDDYDNVPEDIDGQGDALTLSRGRQTTFEGREKTFVGSSPARGPDAGIEGLVHGGTNKSWRWPCPCCGEFFEPDWAHLQFVKDGTPEEAAASVVLICPKNGCVIEPKHKVGMNRKGCWVTPSQWVTLDGEVQGEPVRSRIASYRIHGLMGFLSWGALAEEFRRAELDFERRQDEGKLRAFFNTRVGINYRSKLDDADPVTADDLALRDPTGYRMGQIPEGVKVLTAAVDVQGNRFEVMVVGWGEGLESWVIDRFALVALDDRTKIDPAGKPEHWGLLLERVLQQRYPLERDPETTVPVLCTAIDTGGIEGVSENARKFWHAARRAKVSQHRLMLIKGGTDTRAQTVAPPTYLERDDRSGRPLKRGATLYLLNVASLKDTVSVRLRRDEPGPGYVHVPEDFAADWFEELTAEEKRDGKWVKVRPRNETLDLSVYNIAALMRWAHERSSLNWVPKWARAPESGEEADDDEQESSEEVAKPDPVAVRPRNPRRRRRKPAGWTQGWKH